jgi:hypothetical protein
MLELPPGEESVPTVADADFGLTLHCDIHWVHPQGVPEEYTHNGPDVRDDRASRISLDFANAEGSRNGIEKFITNWGMPTELLHERQFYNMCQLVRSILVSAVDRASLEEMFRIHRGGSYEPTTPFEFAIREFEDLAEHDVLKHVRECRECGQFFIPNKRTAKRKGSGPGAAQQFCRDCGPTARPKARRHRLKLDGALGRTGKKVTADPRYAKPSMRRAR